MQAVDPIPARVRYINAEWRNRADHARIGSRESRRANTAYQDIVVHDARARHAAGEIDLDTTGFMLTRHETACSDFRDDSTIRAEYLPEMLDLVRRITGAAETYHYGYLVRTEVPTDFNNGYARFVHCDYNAGRIEELSHDVLRKCGVEPRSGDSYAWINTWQPFDNPAVHNPLAFIDAGSLPREDMIDYYYTGRGFENLVAAPVYNPDHHWCYFPAVALDELVLIKQMDQRPGRVVYCPHTSFDNPFAPDGTPPRRSIETRVVAVFRD